MVLETQEVVEGDSNNFGLSNHKKRVTSIYTFIIDFFFDARYEKRNRRFLKMTLKTL